jgi:hypothetical protein
VHYSGVTELPGAKPLAIFDDFEEIAEITAQAGALGRSIQAKMFAGPRAPALAPFLHKFQHLPTELAYFSNVIGALIETLAGKRGHKAKIAKNQHLIEASEFVRQKTGKYYDEHVAELLQTIPRLNVDVEEDISGDAIRKKREHLKRTYPLIYRNVVDRVNKQYIRSEGQPVG